jgi:hypothetical protein
MVMTKQTQPQSPVKKAHWINESCVVTIDPAHVRRLAIDNLTFFEEVPVENGILLKLKRLTG